MIHQQYPSQLLEKAVSELSRLPGSGRKTALRLALHLLRQDTEDVERFTEAIVQMKYEVKYCQKCHNISDSDICPICADSRRDSSQVCVVENIQDVMAIENTQQYHGLYHVLGGIIFAVATNLVVYKSELVVNAYHRHNERIKTGKVLQ